MAFALRLRNDVTPSLAPLDGMTVRREHDAAAMAALQGRTLDEIALRLAAGHRAYIAEVNGIPAAWGWVATDRANIGELATSFLIPARERYLWNFVTLPAHRGRGIYPRLLDAIVRAESIEAERFWIAHAPENLASAAGMRKAGFRAIAELSFDAGGRPAVMPLQPGRAAMVAELLGLPESRELLAPCWRCVRAGRPGMSCAPGECRCDYQKPESGCAA